MKKTPFGLLTLGAMCLTTSVLAACVDTPTPTPSPPPTQTPQPDPNFELPAPVYYLRHSQIWRLARDGQTQQQITREAAGIESFDVSPADGALVYVTANTLIHTDALGENRHVLLSGPPLPPAGDELAALNDRARIRDRIATPMWSPDGERIAYVHNGLNLMTASTGEVQIAHPNGYIPDEGEATDRLVIASVISWSPNGQHLLVTYYSFALRSIYDRRLGLKTLSGDLSNVSDCISCTFGWHVDSQTFYLANPTFGGAEALSRCNTADGRCRLIGQDVPARTAYFYAYPHVPGPDELTVFMATSPDPGQPPAAFRLYRMNADGGRITLLRPDEHAIQAALWARDARGVLIVTASASAEPPADTLIWLPIDSTPPIPLPVTGPQMLRWGADM